MSAQRTEIIASSAFTANGNSAAFPIPTAEQLIVGVDVTAQSGTSPILTVFLQCSDDGGTTWYDMPVDLTLLSANTAATGTMSATAKRNIVDTLTGAAAVGQFLAVIKAAPTDTLRAKWIISGTTPSFTFSISMVAK
jgi:hypothetical protein